MFWARFTPTAAQLIGDVVLIGAAPYLAAVTTVLLLEHWEVHPRLLARVRGAGAVPLH